MEGAREYCKLFDNPEQHGRLYLVPHFHARGKTFHIYILPDGEDAIRNGPNAPLNNDSVEVYGIIGGHHGWSEKYGWLHEGRWQDDFQKICDQRKNEIKRKEAKHLIEKGAREYAEKERIKKLLETY